MSIYVDILILSGKYDLSTDRICHILNTKKVPFLRINRDDMEHTFLSINPKTPEMVCKYSNKTWIVNSKLKAVWWRNPTFPRGLTGKSLSLSEQLQYSQWSAVLRSLMLFENALWVNSPDATYKAESKPYQLMLANKLGFHVPNTIITNDPTTNINYLIGNKIALKSADTIFLEDSKHQYFGFTSLINWSDCINEDFYLVPATCQQIITPKLDLRVTVIGDQLWCDAILIKNKGIEGDWRTQPRKWLSYQSYELPITIKNMCINLVKELNLTYGAIDLALSNGIFWFIEINPTGEWGWLDRPDRDIAEQIVNTLIKKAKQ